MTTGRDRCLLVRLKDDLTYYLTYCNSTVANVWVYAIDVSRASSLPGVPEYRVSIYNRK